MAVKKVIKKRRSEVRVGSVLAEVQRAADYIRQRAFELAAARGFAGGHDLDDWLEAEKELFYVPASGLRETEAEYTLNVSVTAFQPHQIVVSVEPQSVTVWGGAAASEARSKELFCQYRLFHEVVVEKARAFYDSGELAVTLPKRSQPGEADTEQPSAA